MADTDSDTRSAQRATSPEPLEQVREILFGAQKRAHESEVERLRARLDALTAALEQERQARGSEAMELRARLDQGHAQLTQEVAALATRLDTAKVERSALADWFEELAQRLRTG